MSTNTIIICCIFWLALPGVEKNNVRKFHLTKSNKWDAPNDILLASKRKQITGQHERMHRQYSKSNTEYWSSEIKEARNKRRKLLDSSNDAEEIITESSSELDIQNLSAIEIKEKLKRIRCANTSEKTGKITGYFKGSTPQRLKTNSYWNYMYISIFLGQSFPNLLECIQNNCMNVRQAMSTAIEQWFTLPA